MGSGNKGTTRSFDRPDDHISKNGVEIDVVRIGDLTAKRGSYPPGWRFSKHMGAPVCYDTHVGYGISGHIHVELRDGGVVEIEPGAVFMIPAGHDAWVVGDEPCVMVQLDEGESAARRFNLPALERAA
jgi:quercetin dioxygenase-like cupin family protein